MIIVKLFGGLGNQMFQYAAGRQLSVLHQVPLKLDLSGFSNQKKRAYALYVLQISESFASSAEVDRIRFPSSNPVIRFFFNFLQKSRIWRSPSVFRENYIGPYNPAFRHAPLPLVLQGYWQSERYFEQIGPLLRQDFSLRSQPGPQSHGTAAQIRACSAVSIHIRRGDYISEPHTQKIHDVCGLDYYHRAVAAIKSRLPNPHFFVFSDDLNWVRQNLKLADPSILVGHNRSENAHEDLWLMSLCQHHIIANSSFSWWGAWLGINPDKIVIAPKKWFNDPNLDTRDLLPSSWLKM